MKTSNGIRSVISGSGAVLVDTVKGGTFSVNPVGARIWKLIEQGLSVDQIVEQVSADFAVPQQTIEHDVRTFVKSLTTQALVVEQDTSLDPARKALP